MSVHRCLASSLWDRLLAVLETGSSTVSFETKTENLAEHPILLCAQLAEVLNIVKTVEQLAFLNVCL